MDSEMDCYIGTGKLTLRNCFLWNEQCLLRDLRYKPLNLTLLLVLYQLPARLLKSRI